jgi:uncharacterized protein
MTANIRSFYLPEGLPIPVAEADGLAAPFWEGLRHGRLLIQRCRHCQTWQFGPEWICHACHGFDPDWVEVKPEGRIFSWERVWHPSHPAIAQNVPYIAVLIELVHAGGVRIVGNLTGDPRQPVSIGSPVQGEFEHHPDADPPYSLLQWRLMSTDPVK